MAYELKRYGSRSIFYFEDKKLSYEMIISAIDVVVEPDEKTEEETTSWTVAYTFKKGDINVYFEHFYNPDHYFSFELYPLGDDSKEGILKLKNILDQLDLFLYKQ